MRFYQVDAFTENPYEGNPCAVFPEAGELSEAQMLKIAREMNLSESAFLFSSEKADIKARYFTPMGEIPLAGHPTIASVFVMLEEGIVELPGGGEALTLTMELQAGTIGVNVVDRGGRRWITMRQLPPRFGRSYSAAQVAPALGLKLSDFVPGAEPQTVSTGTPQLMVALKDEDALRRARIVLDEYNALKARGDFFSPHLFVVYNQEGTISTSARHFGGVSVSDEDPFTGSATGGMAAYLYKKELIPGTELTALQGASVHRPGIAAVTVIPDDTAPEGIAAVEVTGTAALLLTGELQALP
jgi:trans-2,3-dihydro-3-hydroxyanthranilate isomerase